MELFKFAQKKQTIVEISFLCAIFLIAAKMFYLPLIRQGYILRKELKGVNAELLVNQKIFAAAKETYEMVKREADGFVSLKEKFCREEDLPETLKQVQDLLSKRNLKIISFDYQPQEVFRIYKTVPLELNLRGEYRSLIEYLEDIEKLSGSINISEIEIQSSADNSPGMKIKMAVLNYVLRD